MSTTTPELQPRRQVARRELHENVRCTQPIVRTLDPDASLDPGLLAAFSPQLGVCRLLLSFVLAVVAPLYFRYEDQQINGTNAGPQCFSEGKCYHIPGVCGLSPIGYVPGSPSVLSVGNALPPSRTTAVSESTT